jgi:hypothetical protein
LVLGAELPEIAQLPSETHWAVRVGALTKLRKRSLLLRYFPEFCGVIGIFAGYAIAVACGPRYRMSPNGPIDSDAFGKMMLWQMFAPLTCVVLASCVGLRIRDHFLRREVSIVIQECLGKLQQKGGPT